MTFPVVESHTSSQVDGGNTTSHTVDMPSGVVSGDLLICTFANDGSATVSATGWTEIVSSNEGSVRCTSFYRRSDGTEGASQTFTTSASERSGATVYRISGAEDPATQAPEDGGSSTVNGGGNSINLATCTPTGGAKDYLWIIGFGADRNHAVSAWPTNYTNASANNQETQPGGGANSCTVASATRTNNASSENVGFWTITSADGMAGQTIAVHPPSAGMFTLAADQGSFVVNGQVLADLLKASVLPSDQGSFALNGQAADLNPGSSIVADQGSFSINGQDVEFLRGLVMPSDQGSYAINGQDAGLFADRVLSLAQGSYVINGQDVTFATGFSITADQGSFSLNGQAADLLKASELPSDHGSFALNGQVLTNLLKASKLPSDQGSYEVNGQAADLDHGFNIVVAQGSYVINGQDVNLNRGLTLTPDQGSYALNGQAASLLVGFGFAADQGSYTITGNDAALTVGGIAASQGGIIARRRRRF